MSLVVNVVFSGLGWIAIYWMTYFAFRKLIRKSNWIYTLPFLGNMLLGMYIFGVVQPKLLERINYYSAGVNLLGIVMVWTILVHHLSVIFDDRLKVGKAIKIVHLKVSHVIFFSAFGVSSLLIGLALLRISTSLVEVLSVGLYLGVTEYLSVAGIGEGTKISKARRL